jgi:hypothetical protein
MSVVTTVVVAEYREKINPAAKVTEVEAIVDKE